ncbi:MAG: hypothetical protein COZ70_15320 [Deltaproteobacteria bacterium CG_4_8_14_3_um_filter_51_11]|nr:MAG: hypothetical protein AUK25_12690 [Desulfobacteraceae bacterium CG2_30_51_40]PIP48307.1 MAG: hypothetical protein COX16_01425 [Deltaproteobacteria bacterium CG23_combo_of_CG06-09_8_20_14_all_51_20]PIW01617.1 MAG: hypothetical protein COW41_02085 [Deltaproteobacteria bacterium CG17_big_fil_post_rev_8_21_14_2_50_51_6]PIX18224.1 MAG: hypothetical protein COZ70_15320 [Deltaproteobacteria bacterium CG_4_8_14_3_um_filter_51_11]PIY24909.1 MAG: hypothetical protein COZ11_06580 [Deltaproteobacter
MSAGVGPGGGGWVATSMIYRENTPPTPTLPRAGGREILDLAKCRAGGGFSFAGATKYFCHERLP